MGYRSDVIIAISKEVRARHLLTSEIPKCLLDDASVVKATRDSDGTLYFRIESWKWYDSYEEIREIQEWFDSMDDAEFGAMRMLSLIHISEPTRRS